ncbi:MBL fold metallo-hydrolase [Sphingobacterium sp. HJSM2_6]|uniref:MBL fold metallo-hydrolase n=1 Tax=Sphingobacterium sp. HJSM2_6 TaxID=3366264 RepID=UPI003BD20B46
MIQYCALASGSNGNSYYVSKNGKGILIDIGINSKQLHLRMASVGVDPCSIEAIFITHEHVDHIAGLSVFTKKYQIPVFMTKGTYESCAHLIPAYLINIIASNSCVQIGELAIYGIPKIHDAKEPCSFLVSDGKTNIAVLTDLGSVCANVQRAISLSDILILESNYDEFMLKNGRYPYYLKNRISGGMGHLSNSICLKALLENKSARLKHLILGHLSGENNRVDLVYETFAAHSTTFTLSVAERHQATSLYRYESVEIHREQSLQVEKIGETIVVQESYFLSGSI